VQIVFLLQRVYPAHPSSPERVRADRRLTNSLNARQVIPRSPSCPAAIAPALRPHGEQYRFCAVVRGQIGTRSRVPRKPPFGIPVRLFGKNFHQTNCAVCIR
jgi:hypothetical protein